jgi:hypothetical protein
LQFRLATAPFLQNRNERDEAETFVVVRGIDVKRASRLQIVLPPERGLFEYPAACRSADSDKFRVSIS